MATDADEEARLKLICETELTPEEQEGADAFIRRYDAAKSGKVRLTKDDLRLLVMATQGDATIILGMFPAAVLDDLA